MNSAFAGIHQWQSSCSIGIACHGQVADRGSLVIARGNFVEIFEVDDARKHQPLRRRFRIRLEGIPEDMKLCRFPGSKYHSILLSFRPARLSRLDFNPDTYEFETTAMLSFEDPKRKIGNLQDFQPALLAVDPLQRCAVMAVSDCTILAWPCKDRVQLGQVVLASDVIKSIMSAQPTTSANTVLIDLTEYGVKRIKSMAFLNGFLEPSLLILHEPELTWAGRTAVKPSTCVITAISINIDSCKHFLIANEKDIFYDTHTILPLAMPIGGALVISCNMIIHYKQKIEFALSLNEFGDQCTSLRVVPTPSKCPPMVLDRAVCTALSNDTVLIGACDGELYSLTLHTLGDAIRSMEMAKITKTHIASTLCPIGSNLVFLGSKLGDSLLIEWNFTSKGSSNTPSRPSKRAKSDGATDGFDFILNKGASEQAAAVTVKMRDSLFSISPITKIQIGINNQVTPERSEIVACSGFERTGALVVIDDCVRPSVLASFDLKGTATGVWSAFVPIGSAVAGDASAPIYLIVSLESRTIVRKSENNELKTADNDGFALDVTTLYAGNVLSSLVQVTSDEVRILTGSEWKVFGFGIDTKIRYADILDSYIAVLTLDGDVRLGEISFNQGVPEVTFQPISFMSQCSGISLYKDEGLSGLFTKTVTKDHNDNIDEPETAEDLESLLFGSSATSAPKSNQDSSVREEPVYVLAVALTNGSLQILSLPGRAALFVANDCLSGTRLLTNDLGRLDESNRLSPVSACHLLLSTLCDDPSARPSLFISLDNGDLFIYNSFPVTNASNGQIPLAFARFHHGIITRPLSASGIESRPFAVPFSSVRGLSGIFIGGNRPQWLWGNRDFIHSTPQVAEGVVSAFCPFRGPTFAYCLDNTLRICSLPTDIFYDLQVTVRRIPVRLTPHLLTYHAESGTYALVTLKPAKIDLIEGETERTVPLYDKRCQMHLCTNNTMKVVDSFKDFEKDDEAILCVEDTPIASGEKKLHFLSVGTGNIESEEVSCRGRLLLFRVHDTTPSDKTGAGYRYNLAFESKEIGPVSAITAVQGFLCVCVGLRVIMYRWDTDRIVGCAFYDADFYSVSLQSAKGFILLADIYNSAHLLFWEPRLKQIMFLGKDPVKTEVYGADFLVDGEDLSLAICDGECNLRLIGYAPYQPDSLGGRRLLRRADIHIGTRISSFARIRGSDLPGVSFSVGSRYPLLGVGVDGSIICVSPVSDTVYRRLYSLTTLMTYQIRHVAGLNPRQFRTWHSTEHGSLHTINVARNIVDLDFLAGFASLDTQQQERMAVGIGTTPEQIVDDLLQLQLAGSLQVYVS